MTIEQERYTRLGIEGGVVGNGPATSLQVRARTPAAMAVDIDSGVAYSMGGSRYVVNSGAVVIAASDALWYKDHSRLGTLMNESHESLKTDYEVSCDELDIMARICRSVDGVHGARMVGAGFGGSVLAIANTDIMDTLKSRVHSAYTAETKLEASILTCRVGEGARAIHIC